MCADHGRFDAIFVDIPRVYLEVESAATFPWRLYARRVAAEGALLVVNTAFAMREHSEALGRLLARSGWSAVAVEALTTPWQPHKNVFVVGVAAARRARPSSLVLGEL